MIETTRASQDDQPTPRQIGERIEQLIEIDRPRYRRLWAYCRNPMRPAMDAHALGTSDRPYRQAQEWGLPARITGVRSSITELFAGQVVEEIGRKEVVIENDIGWRVETMVDYLFGRPLVISFWFSKGGDDCVQQQDVVERAFRRYRGRVGFLSLDIRDDRDSVRDLITQRGWTMPVGYDRDGAVASLYRVGVCPTLAYVYPGGTLESASVGELTLAQLSDRVDRLLAATAEAEAG